MEKYKVKLLSFEEAFKIWETSPNASVYTNPNFLKNYKKIIFLAALKGDEVMCCWPIFKNKKKILIPNFFIILDLIGQKKYLNCQNIPGYLLQTIFIQSL